MRNTVTDMNQPPALLLKRRSFVVAMASALVLLPLLGLNILGCNRAAVADKAESEPVWSTKIVSDTEPGEPLIVSGTIYSPDGKQPMEGITLYVYQTDATGVYTTRGGDNRATRIHGVMPQRLTAGISFALSNPVLIQTAAILPTYTRTSLVPAILNTGLTSTTLQTIPT